MEFARKRVILHWLRIQVKEAEADILRLMKRLGIDTNDTGDLQKPVHCTNCGFKMINEDELCVLVGQWTCSECYAAFILEVDGIDLNTEEGMKEYQEMMEDS